MRVPFGRVFSTNADGSFTPKVPIRIGGVPREPGAEFGTRVRMGTVLDFASLRGRDLEVRMEGQGYVLVHPHRSGSSIRNLYFGDE
ncbi:MAG TPA: hypothetical protein VM286_01900 [Candidatus Thermoplasmatota archaeon]|nr:hypothetical protein [Candidatus Thermoplasmatota archaeon]